MKLDNNVLSFIPAIQDRPSSLIGVSPEAQALRNLVAKAACSDATVLLTGETGTGKGLVAEEIHRISGRRGDKTIVADCPSISPDLLQAELFGHRKGTFTSSIGNREGIVFQAQKGTLFLDEITYLTPTTQGAVLRLVDEGEYRPVGADRMEKIDVRIIAAASTDFKKMVADGRFRKDLYRRLNVIPIHILPLRERMEDISVLWDYFADIQIVPKPLSTEARKALQDYHWPGNVRELRNVVKRAYALAKGKEIGVKDLGIEIESTQEIQFLTIEDLRGMGLNFKRHTRLTIQHLAQQGDRLGWSQTRMAALLGISRSTFDQLRQRGWDLNND